MTQLDDSLLTEQKPTMMPDMQWKSLDKWISGTTIGRGSLWSREETRKIPTLSYQVGHLSEFQIALIRNKLKVKGIPTTLKEDDIKGKHICISTQLNVNRFKNLLTPATEKDWKDIKNWEKRTTRTGSKSYAMDVEGLPYEAMERLKARMARDKIPYMITIDPNTSRHMLSVTGRHIQKLQTAQRIANHIESVRKERMMTTEERKERLKECLEALRQKSPQTLPMPTPMPAPVPQEQPEPAPVEQPQPIDTLEELKNKINTVHVPYPTNPAPPKPNPNPQPIPQSAFFDKILNGLIDSHS